MFRRCASGMPKLRAAKRVLVRVHVRAMPGTGDSSFEAIGVVVTDAMSENCL